MSEWVISVAVVVIIIIVSIIIIIIISVGESVPAMVLGFLMSH